MLKRTVEWEIRDGEMEGGDKLSAGRSCVEEVRVEGKMSW